MYCLRWHSSFMSTVIFFFLRDLYFVGGILVTCVPAAIVCVCVRECVCGIQY
jgi:hypothetical protein